MKIDLYNEDCVSAMRRIHDESVDVVLTDPPYLYLKNQKLDKPFDEKAFFEHVKRILKKDGFIVMFGRGTSFYRWNTILADLGFSFKEEIIWNKSYSTSPLMPISRVHETISIHTKGKGAINRCKVPYLEMKSLDLQSIVQDIKRISAILHNPKSLEAVKEFLQTYQLDTSDSCEANNLSISSKITKEDRSVSVMRSIELGCNEKSIIRRPLFDKDHSTKFHTTINSDIKVGDRIVNVLYAMEAGFNEKSVIKCVSDRYSAKHPTQKPVRLIERLLALVSKQGSVVCDPFMGSGSTGIACINTGCHFIGYEIDKEYFDLATNRINDRYQELGLFKDV